jgi:HK97 gp10 family phage protein
MAKNKNSEFKVIGLKEAIDAMRDLDDSLKGRAIRSAFRSEMRPVKRDVEQAAPVSNRVKYRSVRSKRQGKVAIKKRNNKLRNNIEILNDRSSQDGVLLGINKRSFYARFIHFGTRPRKTKTGANRGVIKKNPFFEKAVSRATPTYVNNINDNFGKKVVRFLKNKLKKFKSR